MPLILVKWKCLGCGRAGTAVAESTAMISHRVALSHAAKQPWAKRDRCHAPRFETAPEVQSAATSREDRTEEEGA